MVDYYNLLGIDQSASEAEIKEAIKKVRRVWNSRSTNPNADIRAEAEQCIRNIAQAEKTLLDTQKRAEYDASLSQNTDNSAENTASNSDSADNSWIKLADEYYSQHDYKSLQILAQNVVIAQPQNAVAWYVLGDSFYWDGNNVEAERCCKRSIMIEPNPLPYEVLGFVYTNTQKLYDALQNFSKAAELDPYTIRYKFECADTMRLMGRLEEALSILENSSIQSEEIDAACKEVYFLCLRDLIYRATSYNRNSGRHLITNERQLNYVKKYLPKLSAMVDQNSREQVKVEADLRTMVISAESTSGFFAKPGYVKNYEMSSNEVRKTGLQ